MNEAFYRLKPGVPKQVLFFAAAAVWGFAAYKLLHVAVILFHSAGQHFWYGFSGCLIGFYLFYRYIIHRVTIRYITRIKQLQIKRPCLFAFFDLRGYVLMIFMITFGILFRRFVKLPDIYIGSFYGAIGLSLLVSAIHYLYSGFQLNANS